jgi:hypothetical protein
MGHDLLALCGCAPGGCSARQGQPADISSVLSADAAVENALGTLAANTDSLSNYNSLFTSFQAAQSTFVSADSAVARDLGQTRT